MEPYTEFTDTAESVSFQAVVFFIEKVIIASPHDPDVSKMDEYATASRRAKISERINEQGVVIDWMTWRYFEVRPDPDRLWIRESRLVAQRRFLFRTRYFWEERLDCHFDFRSLDQLAADHQLPTISDYYARVQTARAMKVQAQNESLAMVQSWTQDITTEALLEILHHDLKSRIGAVRSFDKYWHYIVYTDNRKDYFKSPTTETLLKSLIFHAEDCFRRNAPVHFDYCRPIDIPIGVACNMSPIEE